MYKAPVSRLMFDLAHIGQIFSQGLADIDETAQVLQAAARFAETELVPLDRLGDIEGAQFNDGAVTLPKPFVAAYRAWIAVGWNGVDMPVEHGGMGLPVSVAAALMEIWHSACMSFGLGPVLTQGAADVLHLHAEPHLAQMYLPRMVSGEWAATMNLTEPQAGSDLGALRTKAVRQSDGTYSISGTKIFITCGEHDYTDNIIHLVLARLPDAPAGTRGISLFLVPKYLVNADGSLGARNDVRCAGIEHKAGVHASPTCVMIYGDQGGAKGWLIGEENRGLAAMFTMMNKARLYTALQGTAVAERALQRAVQFASERMQGHLAGEAGQVAIIRHPDVRRNLLTMRALTAGSRALIAAAAGAIDRSRTAATPEARRASDAEAAILTPVAKAFCSEAGVDVASIGVQVHGGMGFVEETGAIQHWRDARIVPIYEGTNGIQAIDLVTRKLPLLDGSAVQDMIERFRAASSAETLAVSTTQRDRLERSIDRLAQATDDMNRAQGDAKLALATPYLRLFGLVAAAGYMAIGLKAAADRSSALAEVKEDFAFFVDAVLPASAGLAEMLSAGAASTLDPAF